MKRIWHEALVNYHMYRYNRYTDDDYEKRSIVIKKAFYHQDRLLKIQVANHNKVAN
ncbi:hypothetical protein [Salipaludibacillus daqingensis]|uniref:hypothetical protein n=1 Tax=Salipaludibacillus daqingensis TaxID=3041001 RepID=UPI0024756161|nr:hypothetical protein [Salipaludibacillus daqingensis]